MFYFTLTLLLALTYGLNVHNLTRFKCRAPTMLSWFDCSKARFQTSNLIQPNKIAVAENKTLISGCRKKSKKMYSNVFIIYELSGTAVAQRLKPCCAAAV